MELESEPIRIRDAGGRLVAAGARWSEHRDFAEAGCLALAVLVCLAGAGALVVSLIDGSPAIVGLLLLGLGIWLARRSVRIAGSTRELVFDREGGMKAPLGFAHYQAYCREITGHHADIVSIETRNQGAGDLRVVMYFRSGNVVYAAGRLQRDEAHRLAVQLSLALAELREAISDPRREAGHGPASVRAEEFID